MQQISTRFGSRLVLGAVLTLVATASQADVNGCSAANYQDFTGQAGVTVNFGGGLGFTYSPKCIRVTAGTTVTFSGAFSGHPQVGGTQVGATVTPDPSSPFSPEQNSGTSRAVVMANAGEFGYYCVFHGGSFAMSGAVLVVAAGPPDPIFSNGFE